MKINLTKALKKKAKLIALVSTYRTRFIENNSVEVGEEGSRSYDPRESYDLYKETLEELVDLKSAIHLTNAPIYKKICTLAELKGNIKILKDMVIKEGKHKDPYSRSEPEKFTSEITKVERDEEVDLLQDKVDEIQSEIESFNSITMLII